jgi:peptidoglycan/LPS O-acetylase OafA/YrhL
MGAILGLLYGSRGQELDVFALGMGVALLYVWAIEQGQLSLRNQRFVCVASVVLVVVGLAVGFWFWWSAQGRQIPASVLVFYPSGQGWAVAGEWTLGLSYAFLLIAALFSQSWLAALLSWTPLRFIGTISYSLYVWHWVLFQISVNVLADRFHLAYPVYVVVMLVSTVIFCAASYYFIERPFLRLRLAAAKVPAVSSAKAP